MSKARDLADGKFDTDTLVVDAANNRVGIGTDSPVAALHVEDTSAGTGGGYIQIGNYLGSNAYQYINLGGNVAGNDGWQIGKNNNTASSVAPAKGFYIYDLANTTTRLAIDTGGRVTMPGQIAMLLGGNYGTYQTLAAGNIIPFNVVRAGNGTGFNTSTHQFTAPVSGNYFISMWGLIENVTNNEVHILKNGSEITRSYTQSNRGGYGHSIVVNLSQNDYISFLSNNPIYLNTTTAFYSGATIVLIS